MNKDKWNERWNRWKVHLDFLKPWDDEDDEDNWDEEVWMSVRSALLPMSMEDCRMHGVTRESERRTMPRRWRDWLSWRSSVLLIIMATIFFRIMW